MEEKKKRGRPRRVKEEAMPSVTELSEKPLQTADTSGNNFCVEAPKTYTRFRCYMGHWTITKEKVERTKCGICGARANPVIFEESSKCFCRHAFGSHEKIDESSAGHCDLCGMIRYGEKKTRWICGEFRGVA